jgi:hypothetical protein
MASENFWMESHDYMTVNNEKTIFMKWEGSDFVMHGVRLHALFTWHMRRHLRK